MGRPCISAFALALSVITLCVIGCHARTVSVTFSANDIVNHVTGEFLSTTIEISQLYIDGRLPNTSDPTFIQLGKNLAGVRLRVGGTRGDTFWYDMSAQPVTVPPPPYTAVINHTMVDWIGNYATAIGATVAWGVNFGEGPRASSPTHAWTPDNTQVLLNYIYQRGYPITAFEAGNEPNLFLYKFGANTTVPPEQYAQDVALLRSTVKAVNESWWVVAADVDYAPVIGDRTQIDNYDKLFLEKAGPLLDAHTWHFYPLINSEKAPKTPKFLAATPEKLLDPIVLNQVGFWGRHVSELSAKYAPQAQVWLGETGSAVGGGAPNVSNRFVDAFEWQDKLGQLSRLGQHSVLRQTLSQSQDGDFYYGLMTYELQPHPSYWFAVLYRQLVGTLSLDVSLGGVSTRHIRAYAYSANDRVAACVGLSRDQQNATVVLSIANLNANASTTISLVHDGSSASADADQAWYYVWQFTSTSLTSDNVYLNDATAPIAPLSGGRAPPLPPVQSPGTFTLPPASYALVLSTPAQIPASNWAAFPCL